jgi:hypothetical protein
VKLNDSMLGKIFATFAVLALVIPVVVIFISLALYDFSHESCLRACKERYKLNIDNCWSACDDRCKEKFGK